MSRAADWRIDYEDGVPVSMTWAPRPARRSLRCPKTFPHEPHGPWHDGNARQVDHPDAWGFDCPGVPVGALQETGQ